MPSFFADSSFRDVSEDSARKIATLQAKLDKKLGPEYISQRPGPGGGPKLTYAEGSRFTRCSPHYALTYVYLQDGRSSTWPTKCKLSLFIHACLVVNSLFRFGFNGWSSSIVNITTDFIDFSEETRRYNVGITAIVRVTLRDGAFHEDLGYGLLENSKSKGAALDKVRFRS